MRFIILLLFMLSCPFLLLSQSNSSGKIKLNMSKKPKSSSSGVIQLNMVAPNSKHLRFYEGEIAQELEQSGLFAPRGEFEKIEMYQQRLQRAKAFEKEVQQKYKKKYEQYLLEQELALQRKVRNSFEKVDLQIDELGRYDPDNEFFPIKIAGEWKSVRIPWAAAKSFKLQVDKARATADRQLMADGENYHLFNYTVYHPISNQSYPIGKHQEPLYLDQISLADGDQTEGQNGIPELTAKVTFVDPSGNRLLDAKEKAGLEIEIKNTGQGTARQIHALLNNQGYPNLSVRRPVAISEIHPGQSAKMSIGLEAGERIQARNLTFNLSFSEANFFPPAPVNITIGVQGLKPAQVVLAERGIEELQGTQNNTIENGELIKVTAVLENQGELPAENLKIKALVRNKNITLRQQREFPWEVTIDKVAAGEQHIFEFVFALNYNFSETNLPIELNLIEGLTGVQSTIPLDLKMREKTQATQNIQIKGVYGTLGNRRDYALIFAVSDYDNEKLVDLDRPIKDGEELENELREHYDFQTELIKNPTYDDIENKIAEYERNFKVNKNNLYHPSGQLLIYFTGHGETYRETGYFMPADADPDRISRTGLPYDVWRTRLNEINCDHLLVAIDACYSGYFFKDKFKSGRDWSRPEEQTKQDQILNDHVKLKTRLFVTSSTDQKTPDKSDFAKEILNALRKKDHAHGILFAKEIYASYLNKLRPRPLLGSFGDDQGGSTFIFIEKK